MSKKNIRKIKCIGNAVDNNEETLHPTDLVVMYSDDKNKRCPIFHLIKKSIVSDKQPKIEDLIRHMQVPEISIRKSDFLEFYNNKL